jgi:LacI family transcriptional regulator
MASLRDIAKRAGVSPTAVSLVLNGKAADARISASTVERIIACAQELNYRPDHFARSLRTRRSGLVGVVVWDIADPYVGEILQGIERGLRAQQFGTMLCDADGSNEGMRQCFDEFERIPVEGLLVIEGSPDRGAALYQGNAPMVVLAHREEAVGVGSVTVDNHNGGRIAAGHLIERGYRDLVHLTRVHRAPDEEERLQGFLAAATATTATTTTTATATTGATATATTETVAARSPGAASCVRHRVVELPDYEGGVEGAIAEALAQRTGRLGVFAVNDLMAMVAVRAVIDRGVSIPDSVGVIGFDDLTFSRYLTPRLTTIRQPRFEMGRTAADLLVRRITGPAPAGEEPTHIVLEPELTVRESA